jgi:MATE family multidrug resistance protein
VILLPALADSLLPVEVVSLVATIIPLLALFQVADGIAAVTAGILRAQGKQLTGALLNLR